MEIVSKIPVDPLSCKLANARISVGTTVEKSKGEVSEVYHSDMGLGFSAGTSKGKQMSDGEPPAMKSLKGPCVTAGPQSGLISPVQYPCNSHSVEW